MSIASAVSASTFKAKCLSILDQLANHELDRVVITKRGKPVAVLTPPDSAEDDVRNIFGFMRGSTTIAEDVDLTAPVIDEPFTVDSGKLHE